MLFMNEYEIEDAARRYERHPVLGRATRFLKAHMDEVNSHSDGWPYWRPPVDAARQLITLIQAAQANERNQHTNRPQVEITERALLKALTPIKSFYTRRGNAAGMTMPKIEGRD
jgi:hypothetical protein